MSKDEEKAAPGARPNAGARASAGATAQGIPRDIGIARAKTEAGHMDRQKEV